MVTYVVYVVNNLVVKFVLIILIIHADKVLRI